MQFGSTVMSHPNANGYKTISEKIWTAYTKGITGQDIVDDKFSIDYLPSEDSYYVAIGDDNMDYAKIFANGLGLSQNQIGYTSFDDLDYDQINKADLVSIGFDEADMLDFMMNQLSGYFAEYISDCLSPVREKLLTKAALETLAIIAYKQPITKLEIEDVRRVNCDYAVQALVDQDMIEIVGRKEAVGRPLMFGTTENFLKRFNIKDLSDLPEYDALIDRIRVIRSEEDEKPQSDTLFRNVDDFKFEDEEIPDFLAEEVIVKIDD
jgi:segregation and condensation protein B